MSARDFFLQMFEKFPSIIEYSKVLCLDNKKTSGAYREEEKQVSEHSSEELDFFSQLEEISKLSKNKENKIF